MKPAFINECRWLSIRQPVFTNKTAMFVNTHALCMEINSAYEYKSTHPCWKSVQRSATEVLGSIGSAFAPSASSVDSVRSVCDRVGFGTFGRRRQLQLDAF